MLLSQILIHSIFFKNKLEKIGFKNYFIINNKIKKKIFLNLKLSIKNQKIFFFFKYYLLKLFFLKKYTNLYLLKKRIFLISLEKGIKIIIKHITCRILRSLKIKL